MTDQQYDVSPEMRRLYELKQKQRAAAKEYFMNYLYNPHRPVRDAPPFDPALQRFSAMSSYHSEYFKPSGRHWAGFFLYLSPFVLTFFAIRSYKAKEEEKLRSGKVSYSDRSFKLIM